MSTLRSLFGPRLSEADLAVQARSLLERCERLGKAEPAVARRLLRRNGRLVQPAFARDESLYADLVRVLWELGRACGDLREPLLAFTAVSWDDSVGLAGLAEREGPAEAIVLRWCDGDLMSEAEAVCALSEGQRVVLAVVGQGPAMAVRVSFLAEAVSLLPTDLAVVELSEALETAARRLRLDVRRC